jgi:phage-related minor tail protein
MPMEDEFETMVVRVRADTREFARDVAAMTDLLDGPLAAGAERASRAMESALSRFVRTGKFGFEDLKRTVLGVMNEIAAATIRNGIAALGGGGGSGGGNFLSSLISVAAAAFGAPGRATGGPVSPGQAYVVGERGPELFVPTASGRIETTAASGRTLTINVTVNAPADVSPAFMSKSGRQVARAVRQALIRADAS